MNEHNESKVRGDTYWDGEAPRRAATHSRNRKFLVVLILLVVGMVGFAFANARYFGMLCEAIGFGQYRGGEMSARVLAGDSDQIGRDIQVLFVANVQGQLPVTFRPITSVQKTRLGKTTVNDYHFVNVSNRAVYFMPIHNYRPSAANKPGMIELGKCFCFEPQMLHPAEQKSLPIVYQISGELDPSVHAVTFYYTLFEMSEQDYNQWWTERKNQDRVLLKEEQQPS